jgi:hypothetical protein
MYSSFIPLITFPALAIETFFAFRERLAPVVGLTVGCIYSALWLAQGILVTWCEASGLAFYESSNPPGCPAYRESPMGTVRLGSVWPIWILSLFYIALLSMGVNWQSKALKKDGAIAMNSE